MIPTTELRLDSMRRALTEVIAPAIDPANSLAREQAALVIGHISILLDQSGKEERFAALCRDDLVVVSGQIALDGGPVTRAALSALNTAIDVSACQPALAGFQGLSAVVDSLVRAVAKDGEDGANARLRAVLLPYGKRQTFRERIWSRGSGFDPSAAQLPSIDDLLENRVEG